MQNLAGTKARMDRDKTDHGAQRSIQRVSIRYFFSAKWLRTGWRLVRRWRGIIGVLS
jgi:hypothetical protein